MKTSLSSVLVLLTLFAFTPIRAQDKASQDPSLSGRIPLPTTSGTTGVTETGPATVPVTSGVSSLATPAPNAALTPEPARPVTGGESTTIQNR